MTHLRAGQYHAGLCQCGCGQATSIILKTKTTRGLVRGEYRRFIRGHNNWQDLATRFWSKVDKSDGCWLWRGQVLKNGYGVLAVTDEQGKRTTYAHRLVWELAVGPIPPGMQLCHRCDVRDCVRPDHLFLGTQLDNMRDAKAKGRMRFPAPRRGLANHQTSPIAPETIDRIQSLRASGWSQERIAADVGLSRLIVRKILAGRHWSQRSEAA